MFRSLPIQSRVFRSNSLKFSNSNKRFFAENNFSKRETAFEAKDVRKHDEELLAKLRESEKPKEFKKEKGSEDSTQYVSISEFLEFRKEMVQRTRQLEDQILELRSKLKK